MTLRAISARLYWVVLPSSVSYRATGGGAFETIDGDVHLSGFDFVGVGGEDEGAGEGGGGGMQHMPLVPLVPGRNVITVAVHADAQPKDPGAVSATAASASSSISSSSSPASVSGSSGLARRFSAPDANANAARDAYSVGRAGPDTVYHITVLVSDDESDTDDGDGDGGQGEGEGAVDDAARRLLLAAAAGPEAAALGWTLGPPQEPLVLEHGLEAARAVAVGGVATRVSIHPGETVYFELPRAGYHRSLFTQVLAQNITACRALH